MNRYALGTSPRVGKIFAAVFCVALGGMTVAASGELPFKGSLEGSFTVTPVDSTHFAVLMTGTGNATHLGHFTLILPHVVDTTLTAANGDRLTAEFDGASGPTGNPNVFSITESAFITGGTGRFADATGTFEMERLVDLASGLTTGSFDGFITTSRGNSH